MMKLVFFLLLAVGYSLQAPEEGEGVARGDVPVENEEKLPPAEGNEQPEEQEETTEPEEPEIIEINPYGECPEFDSDFPVYLSDRKNCSVFYQCAHGIPYRMTCVYPLEFNPILQVCDFPGRSGCYVEKPTPYGIIGRCPPNPNITKLLRDSVDNTIYYECVNGEPVLRKCPPNTIFSFRRTCEPVA